MKTRIRSALNRALRSWGDLPWRRWFVSDGSGRLTNWAWKRFWHFTSWLDPTLDRDLTVFIP